MFEHLNTCPHSDKIMAALIAAQAMRDTFSDVLSSPVSDYMSDDFRRTCNLEIKAWDAATKEEEV